MNKKFLATFIILGAVGMLVSAAYVFGTFSWSFDVAEPFTVSYYIASNTGQSCQTITSGWTELNGTAYNFGGLYPGDNKKICFKFKSQAVDDLNISSTITNAPGFLQNEVDSLPTLVKDKEDTTYFLFQGQKGLTFGGYEFEVMHTANGTFTGQIEFARV